MSYRSRRSRIGGSSEEIRQQFDTVEQWIEFLKSDLPEENSKLRNASEEQDAASRTFTKTGSLEEAIKLAEEGWPEGIERVEQLSVSLSEDLVKILHVPEVTYDVTGDQLDVGRFVNDEPEDFMRLTSAEIDLEPKILHLIFNCCASGSVGTGTMMRKGAAVVSLVDALEQHGKRVIVDCIAYNDVMKGIETLVRVKESDAPVQLANLVFTLAHPSTLRRLMFRCWEHLDESVRHRHGFYVGGGYGWVGEAPRDRRGDIYIEGMDGRRSSWYSDETIPWLLSELSKQGIHVEREES